MFGYGLGRGDFRLQPEGNTNILDIATSGAAKLGRGFVWGSFDYKNTSAKDTRFNTMTLNLEDDLPFIVSDANVSPWKKQRYDMSFKAATPLVADLVAFGVSANYFTESGAKQVDPRCTDYEYGITVEPAVAFHFSDHTPTATVRPSPRYAPSIRPTRNSRSPSSGRPKSASISGSPIATACPSRASTT